MLVISDRWIWATVAGLAAMFIVATRFRIWWRFIALIGLTVALSDAICFRLIKPAVARPRPCRVIEDVKLGPPFCGSDFGFPSNHASNSMVAAVMLAKTRRAPLGRLAIVLVAALIGFSRIYLGLHYPGDVIAGFFVGAFLGWGGFWLAARRRWLPGERSAGAPVSAV